MMLRCHRLSCWQLVNPRLRAQWTAPPLIKAPLAQFKLTLGINNPALGPHTRLMQTIRHPIMLVVLT
jgi:hypothetical protein